MKQFRIMVYILSLLFILTYYIPYNKIEMPDEVKSYYTEYALLRDFYCSDGKVFNPNFKIIWYDLPGEIIGLCQSQPNSFKISLKKEYWDKIDDIDKFQLLVHELMHCNFSQKHIDIRDHFMAEYQVHIEKDVLYKQIRELLNEKCAKDRSRTK